ncbi:hypothetical protein [Desulfosporosinus sp.]|uniref:hypothetical protein n=1 Tax=Desulfosporosinus sp. TaxID=157907 RepID=UPI0025BBC5BF|nr:hypothetical protein [Desulfosporosinus sp.]MBC2722024.1 hypothetical protein [Desulfosporosinus sp.]MBC2728007.1 hypothetical protein [Desulfosporosinus sp.]
MTKLEVQQKELDKLTEIFHDVEDSKRKLIEGLIEDAAFLKAENHVLKQAITETGMVRLHPQHPEIQKPVETAKQYLKNVNTYAVVIKTLNGVLMKNLIEEDDGLDEFE